jgi:hypothetical protein
MTLQCCEYPIVQHRVASSEPQVWGRDPRTVFVYECPDPGCAGDPDIHGLYLPCRWAWPYAHGKAFNGQSFPKKRCPGCDHIRRAGAPEEEAAAYGS